MWSEILFDSIGICTNAHGINFKNIPANQLVGYLIRLILTCRDISQALDDFQALLFDTKTPTDPEKGFLAFDAHVTDCGCHLRAQMLQNVIAYYKNDTKGKFAIFQVVIDNLKQLERTCSSLIDSLCWNNTEPKNIGFPKAIKNAKSILQVLNWKGEEIKLLIEGIDGLDKRLSEKNSCSSMWNADNSKMILLFIFCSHFLSKHKVYNKRDKKDSVTINFDEAFEKRMVIAEEFHCKGKGKFGNGCRYLKHAKESKNAFTSRVVKTQGYLALLSVSFLKSINNFRFDVMELTRKSSKNIAAIPNFLHFLILEKEWAERRTCLLLAIRYLDHDNSFFDVYFEAEIDKETLNWTLQEKKVHEFESTIPYVIITFIASNDKKLIQAEQLVQELLQAQERFRQFWLTFMAQHPQFPFEIGRCEMELIKKNLPPQFSKLYNYSKSQTLDMILFHDGTVLVPKHIFTEYPTTVFNFQNKAKGKDGALII